MNYHDFALTYAEKSFHRSTKCDMSTVMIMITILILSKKNLKMC